MPHLTSHRTEHLAPKSILRHRPIGSTVKAQDPPPVPRASRTLKRRRRQAAAARTTGAPPLRWNGWRSLQQHATLSFVLGVLLALVLFLLGQLALSWISLTLDDLRYGRPRTYQVDAFVGHEADSVPSHFLALNLHGRLEVIELPGGDAPHARLYAGPQLVGPNADLVVVTLRFEDEPHDPRHPDMLLLYGDTHLLFRNTRGGFEPVP